MAQRQVPQVQVVEKTVEGPQLQFLNKVDEMPVVVERQNHMVQTVQMPMETPQLPCIDKVVDVPVATQQVVHVPQERVVEKVVEISQLQAVGKIDEIPEIRTDMDTQTSESFGTAPVRQGVQAEIGEVVEIRAPIPAESRPPIFVTAPVLEIPVVEQRQTLNIQTEQETIDVPQIQCLEPLVDVPVVTQQTVEIPVVMLKQVPTLQRIQKMVEVPQIQYIDKVVNAPVEMHSAPEMEHVASTLATEWEASTPHVTDSSLRKRKSSGSLQSPRVKAGTRTQVQDDDIRHEVFQVNIASADEMEEAANVHELASKRTPSELDDVKSGVEHVKKDLKEARKMLEFLVRRERKVDTQAEVATRRLERLEREKEDEEDREHETNLEEALVDKTKVVKLVVDKWFVDRGFGFGKVPTGEIVFIHANAVVGAEVLTIGTDAWVQVVNDDARAQGGYRARRAWGQDVWQAEKDKEKANKVAQQVRRAAALTAELAAQSEKKTAAVCDQPPGLDELAGHIEAPNMGAGGSHPQATMMPDPWATFKCPSANQAMVTSPLPASQSFSNFSGKSRKGRPRSSTRAQDNTAVLEETLRLFVEATDKDEASMRQQLVNKRPGVGVAARSRNSGEHGSGGEILEMENNASKPRRRRRGRSSSESAELSNPRSRRNSRKNSSEG